ncbi:uncharacterized protein LOC127751871, partial [Frankliniella occidentalis]|uniref:Uncharacterized protein LOC127751871 n=1 Tax=Frankliniella occidentalis TaxID=133901 RepID=A0A9C6XUN5_FRAOC
MGGEVHMDLQRLIAASRPDLLQCYLKKSVPMGEDDIYYKSILRINDRSLIPQTDADKEEKMTDEEDVPSVDDTIEDGSLFPEVPKKKTWRKNFSGTSITNIRNPKSTLTQWNTLICFSQRET